MNKSIILFLIFITFSSSFSLELVKNETVDGYITCSPKVIFYLENSSSDVTIYSATLNTTPKMNYVSFYPRRLFAGDVGKFEFDLNKTGCNFNSIETNLTVNSTDGVQVFNYEFELKNPLSIQIEKNDESIGIGNSVFDSMIIENACGERNLTTKIVEPQNVYLVYHTPDGVSDNLNEISIKNGYPVKVEIIGSKTGNGLISINFTDEKCSNVTASTKINTQTYTLSKGIISFKSLPSNSIIYFFLLPLAVFGKIIKRRLS